MSRVSPLQFAGHHSSFSANRNLHAGAFLRAQTIEAQVPPSTTTEGTTTDPLIDSTGEDAIYLALLVILVLSALIVGAVSRRMQVAILFALFVSAVLIVLMLAV
jgi:hypothetical protein